MMPIIMGLFGNDKQRDARLDALENHIREVTETVIRGRLDPVALRVAQINLKAQVDGKVSAD